MTGAIPMNEVRSRISSQYAALDSRQQIMLLASLADKLTLMARDTYNLEGRVVDSVRLRNFNEAQNRILSQLSRLLADDERRYPDDVFANILVDQFNILKLNPDEFIKFET
jgi:hypothetical protein